MKSWYYLLFIGGLYFFNQAFQEYIVVYGVLEGVLVGLLIAFVCKFLFKMVTRTIVTLAIIAGVAYFLYTTGYITLPFELMQMVQSYL